MLREYDKPELNIVVLNAEDIVVTSWSKNNSAGEVDSPTLEELIDKGNGGF